MANDASPPSPKRTFAWLCAAVVGVALVLYAPALDFGFSHYDDDALVLGPGGAVERAARPWSALAQPYFPGSDRDHAYYRPLVSWSFALDAARGKSEPAAYHATNVALHAAAGCLVLLLLRSYAYGAVAALVGALAFVVHPVVGAAVGWIPGRDDELLCVFSLAAWLAYRHAEKSRRGRDVALSGVLWLGALLCKEAAIALPLVLVGEALVLERRPLRSSVPARLVVTWAAAFGAYLVVRFLALGGGLGLAGLGAGGLETGLRAIVSGFGALLWPLPPTLLAVPEDMPIGRGMAALAAYGVALGWSRARRPWLGFALLAYLALSLPSLPAVSRLALDSRSYLPAVPLTLALAELVERERLPASLARALSALVLALLGLSTSARLGRFGDRLSFARAAVATSPHSSLAHRNLGVAYQQAGDLERARSEYRAALELDGSEPLVHNNLGVILMAEGRLAEAEQELARELELHPGGAEASRNLALVRQAQKGKPRLSP